MCIYIYIFTICDFILNQLANKCRFSNCQQTLPALSAEVRWIRALFSVAAGNETTPFNLPSGFHTAGKTKVPLTLN